MERGASETFNAGYANKTLERDVEQWRNIGDEIKVLLLLLLC